jgi:hypothetical protein
MCLLSLKSLSHEVFLLCILMMSLALGISCVVFVPTTTLDYKKIDLFSRRILESCTGVSALVQPMHNDDAPGMNLGLTKTFSRFEQANGTSMSKRSSGHLHKALYARVNIDWGRHVCSKCSTYGNIV